MIQPDGFYDGIIDPNHAKNWGKCFVVVAFRKDDTKEDPIYGKLLSPDCENLTYKKALDSENLKHIKALRANNVPAEDVARERHQQFLFILSSSMISKGVMDDICSKMRFDSKKPPGGEITPFLAPYTSFVWSKRLADLKFSIKTKAYQFRMSAFSNEGTTCQFTQFTPPIVLALFTADGLVRNHATGTMHYAGMLGPKVNNREYNTNRGVGYRNYLKESNEMENKVHLGFSAVFYSRTRRDPDPKAPFDENIFSKLYDVFSPVAQNESVDFLSRCTNLEDVKSLWKVVVRLHVLLLLFDEYIFWQFLTQPFFSSAKI